MGSVRVLGPVGYGRSTRLPVQWVFSHPKKGRRVMFSPFQSDSTESEGCLGYWKGPAARFLEQWFALDRASLSGHPMRWLSAVRRVQLAGVWMC